LSRLGADCRFNRDLKVKLQRILAEKRQSQQLNARQKKTVAEHKKMFLTETKACKEIELKLKEVVLTKKKVI
jgi:hypothetical protein